MTGVEINVSKMLYVVFFLWKESPHSENVQEQIQDTECEEIMLLVLHLIESSRWRWPRVRTEKRKPTMPAPCVLLSAMFAILLRTVTRVDAYCAWRWRKRFPCMETMPLHSCVDAKAKCYKQASRPVTVVLRQTKVSFF